MKPLNLPMSFVSRFSSRAVPAGRLLATFCVVTSVFTFHAASARAQNNNWQHSGSIFILTTPDGADLPESLSVEEFPLLVRLDGDWFPFEQARVDGSDFRIGTVDGQPLPFQIEEWNASHGQAAVWVRVPRIRGNDRQELRLYWGNVEASSQSSGTDVFDQSNGFLSVWHLSDQVVDDVGTLESHDVDTTLVDAVIANGRHLAGGQGIFCGEFINTYPSGEMPHSTAAWFRAEQSNATIIGWGNEGGGRGSKVRMQLRSPPHIHVDSDFSDVDAPGRLPLADWIHVAHTYADGVGKIYINGTLAGEANPMLDIKTPARLWLGGWYHHYDFVGDLDEVRISHVARTADWIRLEYENQRAMQLLVGPLVGAGDEFSISASQLSVAEGETVAISAQAGGAQKVSWSLIEHGIERLVAIDRFNYELEAGRVTGNSELTLQFRAVYPDGVRTLDVDVEIKEQIAEPEFALTAPSTWDGRTAIEVVPVIANQSTLTVQGADTLRYVWSVSGPATIKENDLGRLKLVRSLGSGELIVTLALDNGGKPTLSSASITITEPLSDPWIERSPSDDERPVDGQFYARNDRGFGSLIYNDRVEEPTDSVFLRVYRGDELFFDESQRPAADGTFAFSVPLEGGLFKYRAEFGTGNVVSYVAQNLICGDAFLIIGQSNAVATDFGPDTEDPPTNEWVRTFGATDSSPQGSRNTLWETAHARSPGGVSEVGYWGLDLGRQLVERHRIPICVINGAVGGTRIDQHQRNEADPTDASTIYGRLVWRVQAAGLTHGVRGIIWHQGENDQGADGPSGGFGWESYRYYFHELAGSWKRDYPNLEQIYVFQIWPRSCAMGIDGSDNRLREVQRTLPRDFSIISVLATLDIRPPGGCHFPAAGYAEFANRLVPLIDRDFYGASFDQSITSPNLISARFTTETRDEVALAFDQPVSWSDDLAEQFSLDALRGMVRGGRTVGDTLLLQLAEPSDATTITYLDSQSWSQDQLLVGDNGLAALTFCEVPISSE